MKIKHIAVYSAATLAILGLSITAAARNSNPQQEKFVERYGAPVQIDKPNSFEYDRNVKKYAGPTIIRNKDIIEQQDIIDKYAGPVEPVNEEDFKINYEDQTSKIRKEIINPKNMMMRYAAPQKFIDNTSKKINIDNTEE